MTGYWNLSPFSTTKKQAEKDWQTSLHRKHKTIEITRVRFFIYHDYKDYDTHRQTIDTLKRYGRPMICTEYMARRNNSTFQTIMPMLKQERQKSIFAGRNWFNKI